MRIPKVSQMPLTIGALIRHIGEIGPDLSAFSMNPVTGHAVLMSEECLPACDGGIECRECIEIAQRDA